MLFAASAADTELAWYCDFDFSFSNRDSVVLLSRPAAPALFNSTTASAWLSDLRAWPVSARQIASLELMPEVTAFDAAAL
jgi:hypothetical protein